MFIYIYKYISYKLWYISATDDRYLFYNTTIPNTVTIVILITIHWICLCCNLYIYTFFCFSLYKLWYISGTDNRWSFYDRYISIYIYIYEYNVYIHI